MELSEAYDWDLGKVKIMGDLEELTLPCRQPNKRLMQLCNIAHMNKAKNYKDESGIKSIWKHTSCGEMFTIANCGNPTVEFKCNKCQGKVGGINHKPNDETEKVCDIEEANAIITQELEPFKKGYTDHTPEPRPDWALSVWSEYGNHLNIYFAHLLTNLVLLYRELRQDQLDDESKVETLLNHILYDIRIIVETAEIDSVTVCHCLYNLTFNLFLKVSKGEILTLTQFVVDYSKNQFSNLRETVIKFAEEKKTIIKVYDSECDQLMRWINRLLTMDDLKKIYGEKISHEF